MTKVKKLQGEDHAAVPTQSDPMEVCYGCGIRAAAHPFVAVMAATDVDHSAGVDGEISPRGFVSVPVCKACHEDPTHRTRVIKGHFFSSVHAVSARQAAGSNTIG